MVLLQKREKRRWLFRKSSNAVQIPSQVRDNVSSNDVPQPKHAVHDLAAEEEKRAILMAAATIKAAEAAATTAHAAAEIIRLTTRPSPISVKHHFAAILIQTSFRGYLVILSSFYIAYRSFYSVWNGLLGLCFCLDKQICI